MWVRRILQTPPALLFSQEGERGLHWLACWNRTFMLFKRYNKSNTGSYSNRMEEYWHRCTFNVLSIYIIRYWERTCSLRFIRSVIRGLQKIRHNSTDTPDFVTIKVGSMVLKACSERRNDFYVTLCTFKYIVELFSYKKRNHALSFISRYIYLYQKCPWFFFQ